MKKSNNSSSLKSMLFATIVIGISIGISLVYLQLRLHKLETNKFVPVELPPNGTVLFYPTQTPTPIPKVIQPGTYVNNELGIRLTIPPTMDALETREPDGWIKIRIKNEQNITMIISRIKKIRGDIGNETISCSKLDTSENSIERCKHLIQYATSYSIEIPYANEESKFNLFITYESKSTLYEKDFVPFDEIAKSIQFL